MSIGPVAGVGSVPGAPAAVKPEAKEIPGAPDHDGDSDDGAGAAKVAKAPVAGHVNVKV
jgi:hypothetical protein